MNIVRIQNTFTLFAIGAALVLAVISQAERVSAIYPVPDDFYSRKWCTEHQGVSDVRISDGAIADCITSTHVVEFQLAPNWSNAIGRALYYSRETGKKAGIVLIIKDEKDQEYWKQLNSVITHFGLPIDAWKTP